MHATFRKAILLLLCLPAGWGTASAQIISTLVGNGTGTFNGDNIPATSASLRNPTGGVFDNFGNLYIADLNNHRIRKVNQEGIITTIAGTGIAGFNGDQSDATLAQIQSPKGMEVASDGTVYFADGNNHRIRKINPDGSIETIAGTGVPGFSGDEGPAINAQFSTPWGLELDEINQYIYIADRTNDRIRRIDLNSGIITTVAGNGLTGIQGDGGIATEARMNRPIDVALDNEGRLVICDENNNRVRRLDFTTGIITTIAGTGNATFNGNGNQATSTNFNRPSGVAINVAGEIFISDRENQRIRRINTNGTVSAVAGNGNIGGGGDGGVSTSAQVNYPREISLDASGNLVFADTENHRIRTITYCTLPSLPTVTASTSGAICAGTPITLDITSGNLNDADNWAWYTESCGGELVGTGTTIDVTPEITSTYFVRGEGGCPFPGACTSITVVVSALPEITIEASPSLSICAGEEITLTASGAETLMWSDDIQNATPFVPQEGSTTYSVTATNNDGCSTESEVSVTVNPLPDVFFITENLSLCYSSEVVSLQAEPANGLFIGSGVIDDTFDPSLSGSGSFIITYTYTDEEGCAAEANIEVDVAPQIDLSIEISEEFGAPLDFQAENLILCAQVLSPPPLMLYGTPAGGTFSGIGVENDTFNFTEFMEAVSFDEDIPVEITYTYTDENGCIHETSVSIPWDWCTSVLETEKLLFVQVFPNPAGEAVTIQADAIIERLDFYDLTGRMVHTEQVFNTQCQVLTSPLPTGLYVINVNFTNGRQHTERIVISR